MAYIKTTSGWVYTAFIIDVFARANTVNGLYKSEVIECLKEQWHGVNNFELVTLE